MYNDENGRRKMALSITHYVYRNTKLEDYHAETVKMDQNFYRKIYSIVKAKIKNVQLFQRYVDSFSQEDLNNQAILEQLINSVPEELQLRWIRYLQEIIWGMQYGANWDPAQRMQSISAGQSLAGYILAGKFLDCCNDGCILDDDTMRVINRDVHNRVYTLLTEGCFNQ